MWHYLVTSCQWKEEAGRFWRKRCSRLSRTAKRRAAPPCVPSEAYCHNILNDDHQTMRFRAFCVSKIRPMCTLLSIIISSTRNCSYAVNYWLSPWIMLMAYKKQMMVIKCGSVSFYFVLEITKKWSKALSPICIHTFVLQSPQNGSSPRLNAVAVTTFVLILYSPIWRY